MGGAGRLEERGEAEGARLIIEQLALDKEGMETFEHVAP